MTIRQLEQAQRQTYFDRVSRQLGATQAEIEITGLDIGSQVEAQWAALTGLSYDPASDRLDIITEALDHHIDHPREVYVDDGVDGLHSVRVIDAEGNQQVVRLRQPLRLT